MDYSISFWHNFESLWCYGVGPHFDVRYDFLSVLLKVIRLLMFRCFWVDFELISNLYKVNGIFTLIHV